MENREIEQKKEFLKSYRKALIAEKAIEEEIRQLRLDKMCPSIIQDGMPHASGSGDLSGYMARVDELLEEQQELLEKRLKLRRQITEAIERMENETEKTVLRLRYIHCKTWEQVAVDVGYSWRGIHNIHSKALKHFEMPKSA